MKMKFDVLRKQQPIIRNVYEELVELTKMDNGLDLAFKSNELSVLLHNITEINDIVKQYDNDKSLEHLYGKNIFDKMSNENFVMDIFKQIREWLEALWKWIQGLFKSKKDEKPLKEINKEFKSAVKVTNQVIDAAKQVPATVIEKTTDTKEQPTESKISAPVDKGPTLNIVIEKELDDMLSKRSTIVHANAILVLKEISQMYKEFSDKIRSISNPSASEEALKASVEYLKEFKNKTSEKINELYNNAAPVKYAYLCKYADDEIDVGNELDTNTILLEQCKTCKNDLNVAETAARKDKKKNNRLQLRVEVLKSLILLTQSYKPLILQLKKDTNYLQSFLLKLDDKYIPYLPENIKKLRNK